MKHLNIACIFCFVFAVNPASLSLSQSQSRIDSLKYLLTEESDHVELAEIYYDLATDFYYDNPDTSLKYTRLYMESALKIDSLEWIVEAYYWMSDLFYYTNMDSSLY